MDTILVVKRESPRDETTVKIWKDVYDDFKELVESRGMEIKTTITKLVSSYTEKQKVYERYRLFLSITRVEGNTITVFDHKLNRNVTVTLSYVDDRQDNVTLTCDTCEDKEQCAHVAHVAEADELAEAHINLKKSQKRKY